jgi:hypothetical protein
VEDGTPEQIRIGGRSFARLAFTLHRLAQPCRLTLQIPLDEGQLGFRLASLVLTCGNSACDPRFQLPFRDVWERPRR